MFLGGYLPTYKLCKSLSPEDLMLHVLYQPNGDWYWPLLSSTPSIPWSFIEHHSDLPWTRVCRNDVPLSALELWASKRSIDWIGLSSHPDLTVDFVLKHVREPWHWHTVSCHPNMTLDIIEENLHDVPWSWSGLSVNPNLTLSFVTSHADPPYKWVWPMVWSSLSRSKRVTLPIVINNQDIAWNWSSLSYNPNVTVDLVAKHPELPWDWSSLSRRADFTNALHSVH